jgi:gluconate kinase
MDVIRHGATELPVVHLDDDNAELGKSRMHRRSGHKSAFKDMIND